MSDVTRILLQIESGDPLAAEQLLPRYGKGAENMRIDVILVAPWRWPHHLVNVWHG